MIGRPAVAVVLAAALLGSVSALASSPAAAAPERVPTPVTFEPGAINRTPRGGPVPPGAPPAVGAVGDASEVVELRDERTQTFRTPDGRFKTEFYDAPVNYQDDNGAWQPIDNALVPTTEAGYALRNAAGNHSVALPAALDKAPVTFGSGGHSVAFSLGGAAGSPTVEESDKTTATYPAMPGVSVSYTVTNQGLKEDLVLASPQAPASYDFTVALSPGITAHQSPDGGIALVDDKGGEWAAFHPPTIADASDDRALPGSESPPVSLTIVATSPQLVFRLAADPAWLADPARIWPVTIDPTVTSTTTNGINLLVSSAPNTNYTNNPQMAVLGGAAVYRTFWRPSLYFPNFFTSPVDITSATVEMWADTDTTGQLVRPAGAHEITADWNAAQSTWNQRLTGVPWAAPGGDFAAQPLSVNPNITGAPGYRVWPITSLMRSWVNDARPVRGVALKYEDESAGPLITFRRNYTDPNPTRYVVQWEPLQALRDPYRYETFRLGERREASVNVASGTLSVRERDLSLAGTGLGATLDRTYDSRTRHLGSEGTSWHMWPGSREGLSVGPAGDVQWLGGPEMFLNFPKNPDGSYTSPPGYRATLTKAPAGSYALALHESATVYTFDPSGYPRDITDRNANRVSFGYAFNPSTNAYDMVSMTDTRGQVTTFDRIGRPQVTKVTDPSGRTSQYGYGADPSGNPLLTSYTDPAGKMSSYAYDASANLTKITDANGNITTFGYSPAGACCSSGYFELPLLTRLTRVTDPVAGTGPTWTFDYSTAWQTKVTDPNSRTTTYSFDRLGRVTNIVDAAGNPAQTSYTATSFVASRTDALSAVAEFDYDSRDNLTAATSPTGAIENWAYADTAHPYSPSSHTSTAGNATDYTYDGPGNLTESTNAMAATASLTHNADGTVATATAPGGGVTTYAYNASHELITITPPAGGSLGAQAFTYDGVGRLKTATSGAGMTTTYTYDALDRPTGETHSDATAALVYAYDAGGRVTSRTDASGTTTYAYDALSRLTQKTLPGGAALTYTYDAVGNLATATDAGGTTAYRYNKLNLVDQITEPGGRTDVFAYDANHRRTDTWGATNAGVTYDASGNNVIAPTGFAVHARASFDPAGQLSRLKTTRASSDADANRVADLSYAYAVPSGTTCTGATAGRNTAVRQSVTNNVSGATTAYCYDAGARLTRAATGGGPTYAYTYDANGNRTAGPEGAHTYNAVNQATDASSAYDANGNLTASAAFPTLAYNGIDQTTSVTASGQSALALAYAGATQDERRSAGTTTYQNGLLGVQTQATTSCTLILLCSTTTTSFVRDPEGGLVAERFGAEQYYYVFDGLGSVIALVDAAGTQRAAYSYDPYGANAPATAMNGALPTNPWRYAGGYLDSTGLYKFGARYYDPRLGRWTQQDSVVSLGDPANANRYAYAGDDPVNFVDPSGRSIVSKLKCAAKELYPFDFSEGSAVGAGAAVSAAGVEAARRGAKLAAQMARFSITAAPSTAAAVASGGLIVVGGAVIVYGGYKVWEKCKDA